MKNILLAVLFFISLNACAGIPVNAGNDFTVTIPDGWKEIPREVLDEYEELLEKQMRQEAHFDYAYQSASSKNWFEPPYVMVKVSRNGRIQEDDIANAGKMSREINKGAEYLQKITNGEFGNSSTNKPVYDPVLNILWVSLKIENKDLGPLQGLLAVKLIKNGRIEMYGQSLEKDFQQEQVVFRQMFESLILSPADEYHSGVKGGSSGLFGLQFHHLLIVGSLFGLLALAILFFKMFTLSRQARQA
jgi:hypothetical protein